MWHQTAEKEMKHIGKPLSDIQVTAKVWQVGMDQVTALMPMRCNGHGLLFKVEICNKNAVFSTR